MSYGAKFSLSCYNLSNYIVINEPNMKYYYLKIFKGLRPARLHEG